VLLSQILITDSGARAADNLPRIVEQNIASFRSFHEDHDYRLFLEQDVVELIRDKFPPSVLEAYEGLKAYAYRADLARYCLLHEYGGLYADLSYFFVAPVPMPDDKAVVFRGNLTSSPWDTSNGIIFARPGFAAFECAIKLVCENVKRRYYGLTSLCPTGPVVWGKALAMTCEAEDLLTGLASLQMRAKIERQVPGISLPDGERVHTQTLKDELIAVKRKHFKSPGLTELGITDGNTYRVMWRTKDCYA
jgi:hypothetical protein